MSRKFAYTPGPSITGRSPKATLSGSRESGEDAGHHIWDGYAPQSDAS